MRRRDNEEKSKDDNRANCKKNEERIRRRMQEVDSFIHSGHFYSAPSSPVLLRGAANYSSDAVSEFHAEAHMCTGNCR